MVLFPSLHHGTCPSGLGGTHRPFCGAIYCRGCSPRLLHSLPYKPLQRSSLNLFTFVTITLNIFLFLFSSFGTSLGFFLPLRRALQPFIACSCRNSSLGLVGNRKNLAKLHFGKVNVKYRGWKSQFSRQGKGISPFCCLV